MNTNDIRKLTISNDTFDRINTFSVRLGGYAGFRCKLMGGGYNEENDGVLWIMQCAGVISNSYSYAEVAERDRLNSEKPVENNDIVQVDGELYVVEVKGNFSDCAILRKMGMRIDEPMSRGEHADEFGYDDGK